VDLGAYSSRDLHGRQRLPRGRQHARPLVRDAVAAKLEVPSREVASPAGPLVRGRPDARHGTREAFVLAEAAHGPWAPPAATAPQDARRRLPRRHHRRQSPAYSFTAHVAEVEVDVETGLVHVRKIWAAHDCGFALNPTLVEGQIEGSVYMGWARPSWRNRPSSTAGPTPACTRGPNLPRLPDPDLRSRRPEIACHIVQSMDPTAPTAPRRPARGPCTRLPAIANAIYDAVGIRLDRIPFSPPRVLAALRERAELEEQGLIPAHKPDRRPRSAT
jgi:4-hydroxybenzoyl-CoA reductase subunit alpha